MNSPDDCLDVLQITAGFVPSMGVVISPFNVV